MGYRQWTDEVPRKVNDDLSLRRTEGARSERAAIARLLVAVPARDEDETIQACVDSIVRAGRATGLPFGVHVAADSCADATVDRLDALRTRYRELRVVEGAWGNAGAARRAAVASFLAGTPTCASPPSTIWLANTDADCLVPRDWLTSQLRHAPSCDALAGIVELDRCSVSPAVYRRFIDTYEQDNLTHPHVHGANIGMRLSAYLDAGGWTSQLEVGEDHRLWRDLGRAGAVRWPRTDVRVLTSGRTVGRVEGGFATNIRILERGGSVPLPSERISKR